MSGFWLGVVAGPAAAFCVVIAVVIIRELLARLGELACKFARVTPETSESARARFGAIAYSAERSWFLALGDTGICVFTGQGSRDPVAAYDRLLQRKTLTKAGEPTTNPAPSTPEATT